MIEPHKRDFLGSLYIFYERYWCWFGTYAIFLSAVIVHSILCPLDSPLLILYWSLYWSFKVDLVLGLFQVEAEETKNVQNFKLIRPFVDWVFLYQSFWNDFFLWNFRVVWNYSNYSWIWRFIFFVVSFNIVIYFCYLFFLLRHFVTLLNYFENFNIFLCLYLIELLIPLLDLNHQFDFYQNKNLCFD